MPLLTVRHVSTYRYKQPVAFGEHRVMFRPRDSYDQRLLHASLRIDPEPASVHWMHDVFGNCVACVSFSARATMLRFESLIQLEHRRHADAALPGRRPMREHTRSPTTRRTCPTCCARWSGTTPTARASCRTGRPALPNAAGRCATADLLARITQAIRRDFTYVRREEMGIQEPLQTLKLRSGSCRDFALLMMEAVRALGFAARFVSGYLYRPAESRPGSATGGRFDPRLGPGLSARCRLGGVRPDQRHRRQPGPDPGGHCARPVSGGAAVGKLDRVPHRQPGPDRRGQRHRPAETARCAGTGSSGQTDTNFQES